MVHNLSIHPSSYTNYTMHIISYATTAQLRFQLVVKSNTMSLRHNHSPETLIIHLTQCIRNQFHVQNIVFNEILFSKIIFLKILFFKNFIKIYLIFISFYLNLKYFFLNLFYNEQCSFSDSGKIPSRKTDRK